MDMTDSKIMLNNAELIKKEYEWLLELNDDNLSDQVIRTNDVQNALIELLGLADDIINYFERQEQLIDKLSSVNEQQIITYEELEKIVNLDGKEI